MIAWALFWILSGIFLSMVDFFVFWDDNREYTRGHIIAMGLFRPLLGPIFTGACILFNIFRLYRKRYDS